MLVSLNNFPETDHNLGLVEELLATLYIFLNNTDRVNIS
jgi:hypothetical protein